MTSPSDRTYILHIAEEAHEHATWSCIANVLSLSIITLRRWRRDAQEPGDKRPTAQRPKPKHSLSDEEEAQILAYCNSAEFEKSSPEQIVPALVDRGIYIASEKTFYRVLLKNKQLKHRGKPAEPAVRAIPQAVATAPKQVFSWDITYLKTKTRGLYYYLYMFIDIYSRKIVGWEIHDKECGTLASELLQKIVLAEDMVLDSLLLHSDNGAPMRSQVLREKTKDMKVTLSFSRPHTSNDNPFSESVFGTLKMCPDFPEKPFDSLEAAREWTASFTHYYNFHHKHSGINFVTPIERHMGLDREILKKRETIYQLAKEKNPARWSGKIKNMDYIEEVFINKPKDALVAVMN